MVEEAAVASEQSKREESQPAAWVGLEKDGTDPAAAASADKDTSPEMTAQPAPEVKVETGSRPPTSSSSAAGESPPPSRNVGPQRNTNSKFASLREAFEKKASNGTPDYARQRMTSGTKPNISKTGEGSREYETEMVKLQDELKREKELRIAFEGKAAVLAEEIDQSGEKMAKQAAELDAALAKARQLEQLEEARAGDDKGSDAELDGVGTGQDHIIHDSAALRWQLNDLKRSISRSTRPTGQLTDTTLRQEIGLLQHEMQNWVVNNFRKIKVENTPAELSERLGKLAELEQVDRLRPLYEAFDATAKLAIYQATVAIYMMEIFADQFLFGLQGQQDWAKHTRQAAETLPAALDAPTYNRWRAVTFSALTQSAAMEEPVESAAGGMAEMICTTLNALTESEESEARLTSLKTIVKRSISLAHRVRSQQSQYEFVLPAPAGQFEASSMDDIFDDGDTNDERVVRCATFPSLFKVADDEGVVLEPRKIVFRAKVLCREDGEG